MMRAIVGGGRQRVGVARTAAVVAAALVGGRAASAATDVWNNTDNRWETPTAWTPNGPPTAADIASFDPTLPAATVMNPTINATTDVALELFLANNFLGGTYAVGGAGTLTLGTGGVVVRGFGTQTIAGPTLAGAAAGNLTFNVGTDAGLVLGGSTTATANAGAANLSGGTLTLDNSASTTAHLGATTPVNLVGGTLAVLGNTAGTADSLGAAAFNAGFNTVSVTPAGATGTTVNFANGTAGTATSLRTQTFMAEQFVATSGVLGTANGPRITFTGTPNIAAGGLIGNTNSTTSQTVGFATVRDANGVTFATYAAPTATSGGIAAAAATRTATDATTLQASTSADFTQFNAPAATVTATAAVSPTALRITPTGAGGSLALGANNLAANGVMLDGNSDYTIAGTGLLGATGTRYLYVNNATTTLSTSIQVANAGNPTDFLGPGFVALTGTTSQNTLTTNNRLNLIGGVLRGNNVQLGFGATGGNGVVSFRGGVLEITGGGNGTGAAADFTRPLTATTASGAGTGATNWSTSATDQGSGGFSAFGAAASVNLGGATAGVTWNAGGFVNDGYALRFGSTQSNAVLTFQNPVALDAGTAGTYAAREVNVTAGTGGDKTVLSGVVSGSASSDLVKTGTGTLVLPAANTYAGRTLIEAGTFAATTLAGPVIVSSSGTVTAGTGPTAADAIGTLTTPAAHTWVTGGTYTVKLNAAAAGASVPGSSDELVLSGLTLGSTGLTINPVTTTAGGAFATGANDSFVIADATGSTTAFDAVLSSLSVNQTTPGGTYSLTTALDGNGGEDLVLDFATTAAPEPTSVLLLTTAVLPLTVGRRRRR